MEAKVASKLPLVPRLLIAISLSLFLMIGFGDGLGSSGDNPEVGIAIVVFLVVILVAITFGLVPLHAGPAMLILVAGSFVIVGNHFLNFVYGYDWFEGLWYFPPDWVRYVTYAAVGYCVCKRKGMVVAVLASILVVCLDGILKWVGILPTQLQMLDFDFIVSRWVESARLLALASLVWGVLCGGTGALLFRLMRLGDRVSNLSLRSQ